MTTHTTSSVMSNANDAAFQAWTNEFFAHMELQLTQVPQIGELAYPVVAIRPVTNLVMAGWRVYRFDDALQGVAPIFIKVWVGSGNSAASMAGVIVEVGVAVDGSGNFVGLTTGQLRMDQYSQSLDGTVNTVAYSCAVDGYFGIDFKPFALNTVQRAPFGFVVCRTNDSAGAATSVGVNLYRLGHGGATSAATDRNYMRTLRFASPNAVYNAGNIHCLVPGTAINSGGLSGEIEAYLIFYLDPLTRPCVFMCGVFGSEFPIGTTFSATLVGSTPRTYISTPGDRAGVNAEGAQRNSGAAILWE